MKLLRNTLAATASIVCALTAAQAQTGTDRDTQAEMNRGVPGVDVDVGRNADGAVDVKRDNSEAARGVPGVDVDVGRNASGAVDVDADRRWDADNRGARSGRAADGSLAARADRN